MRAWTVFKLVIWMATAGAVFFVGYAAGATEATSEVDEVQVSQLASCLPIESLGELGQCMGLKIVEGQR